MSYNLAKHTAIGSSSQIALFFNNSAYQQLSFTYDVFYARLWIKLLMVHIIYSHNSPMKKILFIPILWMRKMSLRDQGAALNCVPCKWGRCRLCLAFSNTRAAAPPAVLQSSDLEAGKSECCVPEVPICVEAREWEFQPHLKPSFLLLLLLF